MNEARSTLIAAATAVCGAFSWGEHCSAGSVGAAILTAQGNIYTGICIDLACGLGFCAEVAAVAEMLKARERHVLAVELHMYHYIVYHKNSNKQHQEVLSWTYRGVHGELPSLQVGLKPVDRSLADVVHRLPPR
jgi:hypothetical protein